IFDDRGNRMTPSYTRKRGARYGYYISYALLQSRASEAGSVARVPAPEIEEVVVTTLRANDALSQKEANITAETVQNIVERIELGETDLQIALVDKSIGKGGIISVPWQKRSQRANKGVLHASTASAKLLSPETRDALLYAIARARKWVEYIDSGAVESLH